MRSELQDFAKIGLCHNSLFPFKDDPVPHLDTIRYIVSREDIELVELTIPYGQEYREKALEIIEESNKTVIYNGYLMPTSKMSQGTLSYTEREQILMLAKDQVDVAYRAGAIYLVQSIGKDPGENYRKIAYKGLKEYMQELAAYMLERGEMKLLIEPMDRDLHKKSLCGPTKEIIEFLNTLNLPNVGVIVDIAHIPLMGESFEHAIKTSGKFLHHVHLGNCILKDRIHPLWGDMHPPIGIKGGEIGIPELIKVFKLLLDVGYLSKAKRSTLTLEIRSMDDKNADEIIDENLSMIYRAWEKV